MKRGTLIISLMMLFLAGFMPTRGASHICAENDSLPLRRGVVLTTDGQKRWHIYDDYKGADSLFRRSIAEDSTYSPAYYELSQLFSSRRMSVDSVLKYARKAYGLDSINKWYGEAYAQGAALNGDFATARRLYQAAIEREPQNLNAYIMVAMLYRQTSEPLQAIATLDSAEVRTGKNSYLSALKRDLLISVGQQDRAIAEAKEIIEIEPDVVDHRVALADLYVGSKQDSLAQNELERAAEMNPNSIALLNSLAQFYADRNNFPAYFATIKRIFRSDEESLENKIGLFMRITSDQKFYAKNFFAINELATQLYISHPKDKRVVEIYAQHLIAAGSLDRALELYKKHLDDEPAQYEYYSSVIDIESYKENVDSVELYAARAIELFPDREELHLSQANLYTYTKRYDLAMSSYKKALNIVPSDSLKSTIWGRIGDIYHQKSLEYQPNSRKARAQMKRAYRSYDKALELYSKNQLVLNNYAYFLSIDKDDLERALDMAGRAIALEPDNSTYLDTYAWVLYELGRYDEAKKIMRKVIALDTTQSADIQFHYAEILAALGENFMAEVYYDRALKLGYNKIVIENRKSKLK